MPLFLPQLTRREFVKRAALTSAGMALAPGALAAGFDTRRDPNTFAFFSDTHIAASQAERRLGVNMSQNLAACARALADWPVRPATIIVDGDLAYLSGKPEDYATFGALIAPLRAIAPIHLSLGNHDQRDHFWAAFPADAAAQSGTLQRQTGIVSSDHANWFLLDSLEGTDKAAGDLGQPQLDWLAKELDARPDKPAIIVVHHNPQFDPVMTTGLRDTRALMEVIVPRRQVKQIIFGHTHDWHVSRHESGIHLVNLPPTAYVFIPGRPSGWVRSTLTGDGAEFELRTVDQKHPEHGRVHALKWRSA